MKISIITVVFNRHDTIGMALSSLRAQTHAQIEHIVIDGGSLDGTLEVLESQADPGMVVVSEPDDGIYDALNKGLRRTTGDVVGILHSDDVLASPSVLSTIAKAFEDPTVDAVYGDLHYVAREDISRVFRHWRSGEFSPSRLRFGWMPPHPALFLRRRIIERHGGYDPAFRIAGDYDAILRYFSSEGFRAVYIPEVLVKMRVGGESNSSLSRVLRKSQEDYRALRRNSVGGLSALMCKNLRKIGQFF